MYTQLVRIIGDFLVFKFIHGGIENKKIVPIVTIAVSVQNSRTSQPKVFLFEGIDKWRVVNEFDTFPTREYEWVGCCVAGETDNCRRCGKVQVYIGSKGDGTCEIKIINKPDREVRRINN